MKLLFHGQLWQGGTARQRAEAFSDVAAVEVISLDVTKGNRDQTASIYERLRWRLGHPVDHLDENVRLLRTVNETRPDVVLVDNSKVIRRSTLEQIRSTVGSLLVYYTPDDVMARHNLKRPLLRSFDMWDVFFTTKTFNVAELVAAGVRRPVLVGKSFDPDLHRPMTREEIGEGYEAFDVVFIGAFEPERCASLNALAEAGMRVLVHGASPGALSGRWQMHPSIVLRPPVFATDYTRAIHNGKIALCFLRKINRDRLTQRSVELPAMARPMLAEKTDEHDAHFDDGTEYFGFVNDDDMVAKAQELLADDVRRLALAAAGRQRCIQSNYATTNRAAQMIAAMRAAMTGDVA